MGSHGGDALPRIYRLSPCEQVRSRSPEERKSYRMRKFREYFEGADPRELALGDLQLEGRVEAIGIKGLLVGLLDLDGDTLALGVTEDYVEETGVLRILTPLKETEKVRSLQLGSLRLLPSFEDERTGLGAV